MSNNVYVIVEHLRGKLDEVTLEMLGIGKELAGNLGGELTGVLMGHNVKDMAPQLGAADKIICVDDAVLAEFNPETYSKTASAIVSANKPKVVMTSYSSIGVELAPAISVANEMSLAAYVSAVSVSDGKVTATSQLYGGKMNIEAVLDGESSVICVLPGAFPVDAGKKEGSPAIEDFAIPDLSSVKLQFKQLIEPDSSGVDITTQDILVSVGRGIQSNDNLPMVEELAAKLGGAVSCSRPLVDSKWLPKSRQVGKSGLKVKPKLYLALGISGAPEHIEGMKDAELIIAVNTDANAPIYDYAHYAVVGDVLEIIPALTAAL